MLFSRRNLLKMGAALAAVPLTGDLPLNPAGEKFFLTGSPELDHALGGGLRMGSFLALLGPRASGKTAFLLRLAKANGIQDAYPIGSGTSDMLSIMQREDGKHLGSLMLNAVEPCTDQERSDMQSNPDARDAFLTRWFTRTHEVVRHSGGLFVISACHAFDDAVHSPWLNIPDYVIALDQSKPSILKCP